MNRGTSVKCTTFAHALAGTEREFYFERTDPLNSLLEYLMKQSYRWISPAIALCVGAFVFDPAVAQNNPRPADPPAQQTPQPSNNPAVPPTDARTPRSNTPRQPDPADTRTADRCVLFSCVDTNGDTNVTRAELANYGDASLRFETLDTDRNGNLSSKEWDARSDRQPPKSK
jgi:hypothetical protein